MNTHYNLRAWREWSDAPPSPEASGCVEAEYVDERGMLAYAQVHRMFPHGVETWGHITGSYRTEDLKYHHPKYHRWRYVGPLVPSREAQGKAILVWKFYDAPGELRALSRHGGDEDYIGLVPDEVGQPPWMESGTAFGCCDVSEHRYEDGRLVFIGAHA